MGRPKGHPGPVKPDEEKQNNYVRFGLTRVDRERLDARVAALNLDRAKYFRMLMVADFAKNID